MAHESDDERERRIIREGEARRAFVAEAMEAGIPEKQALWLYEKFALKGHRYNEWHA